MAALAVLATSCKDKEFGIEYALNTHGDSDGVVDVTFAGGSFDINGAAAFKLNWSNVQEKMFQSKDVVLLDQALSSQDVKVLETAKKVDAWLDDNVSVSSASGTYDLYLQGYIKETFTGLKFEVNRHFTNRE